MPCFNLIKDFHVFCRHLVKFSNKSKNPKEKSKVKTAYQGNVFSGSVIALENCFLDIERKNQLKLKNVQNNTVHCPFFTMVYRASY